LLFEDLPAKYKELYERLEEVVSPQNNFKTLRTLQKQPEGCIPVLGNDTVLRYSAITSDLIVFLPNKAILLRDLTFIEDGNPTHIEKGVINFQKQHTLVSTVLEYQKSIQDFSLTQVALSAYNAVAISHALSSNLLEHHQS